MRKSIKIRKEKTLILRIYSEMNDIRLNKGASIELKKTYYLNFYTTKTYERFMRFLK
jgi:hypothetical protein